MPTLPPGAVVDQKEIGLPPGAVVDEAPVSADAPPDEVTDRGFVNPFGYSRVEPTGFSDRLQSLVGIGDVALMGAQAGIVEINAGLSGLIALALTGDPDYAKERIDAFNEWGTRGAWTEGGKKLLEAIAPPMSKAMTAVEDFSEEKATFTGEDGQEHIDPAVAAAIQTGILGSVDIASAVIPGAKAVRGNFKLNQMRKTVMDESRRLGIDMHLDHFADDVADAAKIIGSESAGEAATEYVTALRNAEYLARLKKNSLYMQGLDEKLFVSTSPVRRMGAELARDLDGKFDLDGGQVGMNLVRRSLDDMHSRSLGFGSGQTLAVHFNKFEMLRQRLNGRIRDTAKNPKAATANAALVQIRTKMDDWMTAEFNKAATAQGQAMTGGNALSGDAQGFATYLNARKAATEHAWFKETKVIADILKKDASVDQVAQWLIGASAMGKRGGAAVVERMNLVLGKDSDAMAALRADFVYQLTEPLLKPEPNFAQFANNYDRVLRKNKPLVDALGLQEADVAILADYASVARQLPPGGHFYSFKEVIQTVARLGVGHGVAKGAARVTFATKVMNAMGRVDAVTKKQITGAVIDARFGQPFVPRGTPVYTALVAGAALTGMDKDEE